jgi:Asp-tRNA(Asn)/Glu-tRNA(Gln) amidotransferase A subunit family amidase
VPNGLGRLGLPTSIAFAGARFAENAILDAASALQERSPGGAGGLRPTDPRPASEVTA